jgi:putative membrane protein insertion efficiency factor
VIWSLHLEKLASIKWMIRKVDDKMIKFSRLILFLNYLITQLSKYIIRFYQLAISPFLGCNCRFMPTCSHYAAEAIENHGIYKGGVLAAKRLLRCHPFAKAGYDPVPTINPNLLVKTHEKP